jgi:DNA-binding MarR family transcriptional regulator
MIAETYKHKFALSITEWRIMAVLGEYPGISADEVSNKTRIEKSLISRAVAKLLQRQMITRHMDADDKRRSVLQLSETGRAVYDEVVPVSYAYEEKLLQCFSADEAEQFSELLDKLQAHCAELDR